jgi:hypothetical protein
LIAWLRISPITALDKPDLPLPSVFDMFAFLLIDKCGSAQTTFCRNPSYN